ncbi:hypothetical protein FB561_2431 [Kribbella amoyensis]|uniref:Uncharacterized protein n=2 Tax=Kribbella amoyensis TaxID=996641 RepID=A0A561BR20_9ACTN|nr:hypothetical protein FB561_2431 [Kribbella amoyensis]
MPDEDVTRFVVADSAVGRYLSDGSVPMNWRVTAATLEADNAEDPPEQWWARGFVARGEFSQTVDAGRALPPEVTRRYVDPVIAATLARGDLPAVPSPATGADPRPVLHVYGNQAWQRAYEDAVTEVVETALDSPEDAKRLLAIGDANWQARDADAPEFEAALTAAGASPAETRWLQLAASARSQGWDSVVLRHNEAMLHKATGGIASPGTTAPVAAAQTSPGTASAPHVSRGNELGGV